jgi:predicted NBD/HSP70 family sugar kinase
LKNDLEELFQAPIHIVNDAMMGGLAQSHFGPAQGYAVSVYMTVSTSVGGARIVDGKIDRHTFGFEPGWQIIDGGNALCDGWSERGFLADYVGGHSIEKRHGMKPKDIDDALFWRSRAELLAIGLYNVTLMWSPEVITVGGSIMEKIPFDHLERTYRSLLETVFSNEQPALVPAQFGDEMGLWGALGYIKIINNK